MTRSFPLALTCVALLSLCGCHSGPDDDQQAGFHSVGPKPPPKITTVQTTKLPDTDEDAANAAPPPPPPATSAPAATTPPAPRPADYPYGVPVQGKPGFVTSPYAPDNGYVDVRGYSVGQEVRDPYTNKIFLVP